MNRPENRLGSERFARFSQSRVGLYEDLSHSTRQTKGERPYDGRLVSRVWFDNLGYCPGRDKNRR
eukprot:3327564-Pleurochrysis_carterae.AAC.1